MKKHWSNKLPKGACPAAKKWCANQPDAKTAWQACDRPDWMLWIVAVMAGDDLKSAARRRLNTCLKDIVGVAAAARRAADVAAGYAAAGYAAAAAGYAAEAAAEAVDAPSTLAIVRKHYPQPPELTP